MPRRRLPIGIQTLRQIRAQGAGSFYVDKTPFIRRMVDEGTHYFLSRPRRFGKSVLVDTIQELFEGNRPLFEGLAIAERWDWDRKHPVIRLDFSDGHYHEPGLLLQEVEDMLGKLERSFSIRQEARTPAKRFGEILEQLHETRRRRVVVLVDEYDRPVLDAITAGRYVGDGRRELARGNRDFLRGLYSVIKSADAHIRFSFFTGVSKFAKVSLFSGLNNLSDITLDPRYSAVCGYTDTDLDTVFAAELAGLDRGAIRAWYTGYNWRGKERLYNPFAILRLFDTREFRSHWFETGSPGFLVETLFRRRFPAPDLEHLVVDDQDLSAFDVEDISTEALLFQTGYLTIREERPGASGGAEYRLGYPNREVRIGLNRSLLRVMLADLPRKQRTADRVFRLLEARDATGLKEVFHALFAGIPHQWYTRNDLARYEGYYASLFYMCFSSLDLEVRAEESTSRGRLDLVVRHAGHTWIFEFKVIEQAGEGSALRQLKEKGYADRYRGRGEPIHLIGVEFRSATRNIARFEIEDA